MSDQQQKLMIMDPAFGTMAPYPSHAQQWREYHDNVAWLFNPWEGTARHPADIGPDPFGHFIIPAGESVITDTGLGLSKSEHAYNKDMQYFVGGGLRYKVTACFINMDDPKMNRATCNAYLTTKNMGNEK